MKQDSNNKVDAGAINTEPKSTESIITSKKADKPTAKDATDSARLPTEGSEAENNNAIRKADAKPQKTKKKKEKDTSEKNDTPKGPKPPHQPRAADPETMLWISALSGAVALILYLMVSSISPISDIYAGIVIAVCYAIAQTAIIIRGKLTASQYTELQNRLLKDGSIMTSLLCRSSIPAVLTHDDGTVIWYNDAMKSVLGIGNTPIFGKKLSKYCPFDIGQLLEATQNPTEHDRIALAMARGSGIDPYSTVGNISSGAARMANGTGGVEYLIDSRRFIARSYVTSIISDPKKNEKRNYNLTLFEEVSELFDLKDKLAGENLVVAYIVLDNLQELAQYARVDYRIAANNIELHLKDWSVEMGGVLCEYDRDKYMILFSQERLEECVETGFPILEKIRTEQLGDGEMAVTVSMGISGVGITVADREQNAQLALDTALRRGGDQVVIKKEASLEFFGGRSKSIQKREKVVARVVAKQLAEIIKGHSKIMIMGHKNPDCDSIGACIGMSRFVRSIAKPESAVRVVVNTNSDTFLTCTAELRDLPDYKNMFLDAQSALDGITSETLLIVVDANNFNIVESSDIARSVSDIVVVDHHRKTAEFSRPLLLEYIDPSASSASELITEMIESLFTESTLLNEEADVLLSGIMLDTMNFTRSTGMRTFSAAYFLRSSGATSEKARVFFEDDITQHLAEAKFFMPDNVTVYREKLAIAISMGTDPAYDRIAAAKAAERLITTRHIEAAFALVKIGDSIVISARSTGKINVQLILERLHGGGHFDSAGAQVNGKTMNEVLVLLKSAINHCLED